MVQESRQTDPTCERKSMPQPFDFVYVFGLMNMAPYLPAKANASLVQHQFSLTSISVAHFFLFSEENDKLFEVLRKNF